MKYSNDYELPQWEHPESYGGFSPIGDFYIYSVNRDSSILEQSNFECIKNELEKFNEKYRDSIQDNSDIESGDIGQYVYTFTANHWACGWVEYMLCRQDAPEEIQKDICEILGAISDYPVFNDSDYSNKRAEVAFNYWDHASIKERVCMCIDHDISIFSARHDYIPDNNGSLDDYLSE